MSPWFTGVILILALIAAGIGLYRFKKSAQWDSVKGVVLESSIEKIAQTASQQGALGDRSVDYKINIKYKYRVGGADYIGKTVIAGMPNVAGSKKDGEDIVKAYPGGGDAVIYYNPQSPSESALITGKSVSMAGFVAIAIIILAASGIIFGLLYAMKRFS